MGTRWLTVLLVLSLASTGCLQGIPQPNSTPTADQAPPSGENQSPASPSPSTPNTTNQTTPTPPPPLNLTIQPHASYATLHAHPNHTITNITLTNPQNQTQTLTPNKPAPLTLGHLTPNTAYEADITATHPNQTTPTTHTQTFTTQPSKRTYPNLENEITIQPGDLSSGCTLNVVLRNPTNTTLYMLTAGHCTKTGERASHNGEEFGTVVATNASGEGDWALIQVDRDARDQIHPTIRHWTGPPRITSKQDVNHSDTICWYGQGSIFGNLSRHRCGDLDAYHPEGALANGTFRYRGPAYTGDSGAPVLHYPTGSILGILGGPTVGTTICFALEEIHKQGYGLSLLTSAYAPPPEDPFLPYNGPSLFYESIEPGGPCPSAAWTP